MVDISIVEGGGFLCDEPRWRRGPKSVAPARLSDIECDAGRAIECQALASLGKPLLYAFSEDLTCAAITFHRDSQKLLDAPFLYQAQIQNAGCYCLASGDEIEACWTYAVVDPVFVISPGRVGSTLFSNIIKYGGVACLSEPDALSSFKMASYHAGTPNFRTRFERMLMLSVNSLQSITGSPQLVIKLRSYSAPLVTLLAQLFSKGKFIFLFREVEAWASSMVRAFKYNDRALQWIMEHNIKALRKLRSSGKQVLVIDYDRLIRHPCEVIESIQHFIGPEIVIDAEKAAGALAIDSQRGTALDREILAGKDIDRTTVDAFLRHWDSMEKLDFYELGIAFLDKS